MTDEWLLIADEVSDELWAMIGHVVYQIFSHNNNFLFGAKAMILSDINDKYPILLSFIHYDFTY